MRRVLPVATLAALFVLLGPAAAGAMPPNEILIARNLQRLGVVPSFATSGMARGAAQVLLPREPRRTTRPIAGTARSGQALGRYLRTRRPAGKGSSIYAANTLVLLVEFGTGAWPDGDSAGHDMNGPLHGQIPAPAAGDNATFWPGDFTAMHYQQMLFGNSYPIYGIGPGAGANAAAGSALPATILRGTSDDTVRNYYLEQSHGAYTVQGDVADWVRLDLPESYYGADSEEGADDLTGPIWRVARDAIVEFAQTHPDLDWAKYDRENPYGITGREFDRPDGYIDHLILVHAGSDQSAGGGAQGNDAIWAHSWDIYQNLSGGPGPGAGGPGMLIPGTEGQGPQGRGIWAFNYTINPEDGNIGVFCHEYGHDLGLPDEYDTSSVTGDATSGFWTLMSSGSWLGRRWGLGTEPASMNVWDKSFLGFVRPQVVARGEDVIIKLQPAAVGDASKTGVRINLPRARHTIRLSGQDGSSEWYSTTGNNLDAVLEIKNPVQVGPHTELTYRTWYDIEEGYDHGLVEVSSDGGRTWDALADYSGAGADDWARVRRVDLSGYRGKSVRVRFEYFTDSAVPRRGWELRDIAVDKVTLPTSAFTSGGWMRVDGRQTQRTRRYYIAEYRTYDGFDAGLRDCYQWNLSYDAWVDWYSYNRGLHLIYRDTFYDDNDVANHPGHGGWMVVDAHPRPDCVVYSDGAAGRLGYWRPRIQVRDASFSPKPTKAQSVYFVDYDRDFAVREDVVPGKAARALFSDARTYWFPNAPQSGVRIPKGLGVRIFVKSMTAGRMTVRVNDAP